MSKTDRELLLDAVQYLDHADKLLNQLGTSRQAMSVGPPLTELRELQEDVYQRGRDYEIVDQSMTDVDILQEARRADNSLAAAREHARRAVNSATHPTAADLARTVDETLETAIELEEQ